VLVRQDIPGARPSRSTRVFTGVVSRAKTLALRVNPIDKKFSGLVILLHLHHNLHLRPVASQAPIPNPVSQGGAGESNPERGRGNAKGFRRNAVRFDVRRAPQADHLLPYAVDPLNTMKKANQNLFKPRGHSAVHSVSSPPSRITAEPRTAGVPTRYCPGGYHPVNLGDRFHDRYRVVQKFGFGVYSTAWLANDEWLQPLITMANFSQQKPVCCIEDCDCGCIIQRKAYR